VARRREAVDVPRRRCAAATRGDVPAFDVSAQEAANMQIVINTVRCGQDNDTAAACRRSRRSGRGEFSTIRQDGGVNQSRRRTTTRSRAQQYGRQLRRDLRRRLGPRRVPREGRRANAAPARRSPIAPRGTARAARDDNDVLAKVNSGSLSIDSLDEGKLPADLKAMPKDALKAELARAAPRRIRRRRRSRELQQKRAEYIHSNKAPSCGVR